MSDMKFVFFEILLKGLGIFMEIKEIKRFLDRSRVNQEKFISIGFVNKDTGVINTPYISYPVKNQLFEILVKNINKEIQGKRPTPDKEQDAGNWNIEIISKRNVLRTGSSDNCSRFALRMADHRKFDWQKVDYCIVRIESHERAMNLYRQAPKIRKSQKGVFLRPVQNELECIEPYFLEIDGTVDILEWGGDFLVFNHGALERIFGYKG